MPTASLGTPAPAWSRAGMNVFGRPAGPACLPPTDLSSDAQAAFVVPIARADARAKARALVQAV